MEVQIIEIYKGYNIREPVRQALVGGRPPRGSSITVVCPEGKSQLFSYMFNANGLKDSGKAEALTKAREYIDDQFLKGLRVKLTITDDYLRGLDLRIGSEGIIADVLSRRSRTDKRFKIRFLKGNGPLTQSLYFSSKEFEIITKKAPKATI